MSKRSFVFAMAFLIGGLVLMTIGIVGLTECAAAVNSEGNATSTDESVTDHQVYEWSDGSAIIISGDGDNVINIGALPSEQEQAQTIPARIKVFEDGMVILELNKTEVEMPDGLQMDFSRIIMELTAFELILFEQ
jgi:hypothetical protein